MDENEITNSLFINFEARGIGDSIFFTLFAIKCHLKYTNIYIYWEAVHYYGFQNILNKMIMSNNCTNIIIIPSPKWKNDNTIDKFSKYFLNSNNINITNSNILVNISDFNNEYTFYYELIIDHFKINYNTFYDNIKFNLTIEEEQLNINYYDKLINYIDSNKYIIVFDCQVRFQHTFFKDYYNDMNPHNYKIIYINNNEFKHCNNFLIKDCLNIPSGIDLLYYHKIIENAQELHIVNSAQLHYFNFLFNINKEKYKHIKKIIYPRMHIGYSNTGCLINNLNNIYDINFCKLFNIFEIYYPLDYFKHKYTVPIQKHNHYLQNCDKSIYCKFLPITWQNNITINKTNLINIDLINNIFENINYFNYDELLSLITKIPKIINEQNIICIKTNKDYFIKIKERIIDSNDNYLNNLDCINYNDIDDNLIKLSYFINNCIHIDYVYPYKNDLDKDLFIEQLNI